MYIHSYVLDFYVSCRKGKFFPDGNYRISNLIGILEGKELILMQKIHLGYFTMITRVFQNLNIIFIITTLNEN